MVSIMSTTATTSLAVCLLLVSLGNRTLLLLSPDNTIYSTITTVTISIKGTDKLNRKPILLKYTRQTL